MPTSSTEEIVKLLIASCPKFCAALTQDEVATFVRFTKEVEAKPNEIIADIGKISDEFYLVLDGAIKLMSIDGDKELEIGRIEAGCLAGEMSFFDRQPRSIRLRADKKKSVRVLAITRPMYKRLCFQHPYIAVNLLEFVIMSLDKLIRNSSKDMTTLYKLVTGIGYR